MDAARLKAIPLFAGLGKKELKRVANLALALEAQPGDRLLNEGAYAFEFFVIESGAAEVVREGKHLADLGAGDVVGEMGALSHGQRTATVIAKEPTTVIYIRAQDFRHFANEMPALGEKIHRLVDERTRSLADQVDAAS